MADALGVASALNTCAAAGYRRSPAVPLGCDKVFADMVGLHALDRRFAEDPAIAGGDHGTRFESSGTVGEPFKYVISRSPGGVQNTGRRIDTGPRAPGQLEYS